MEHGKWCTDGLLLSRVTSTEWCIPPPYYYYFFFYTFQNQILKTELNKVLKWKGNLKYRFKVPSDWQIGYIGQYWPINLCVSMCRYYCWCFIVFHLWLWFITMILKTDMNGEFFKYSSADKSGRQYIDQYWQITCWYQQILPLIYHDFMYCFWWRCISNIFHYAIYTYGCIHTHQQRRVTLHLVWSVKWFSMNFCCYYLLGLLVQLQSRKTPSLMTRDSNNSSHKPSCSKHNNSKIDSSNAAHLLTVLWNMKSRKIKRSSPHRQWIGDVGRKDQL